MSLMSRPIVFAHRGASAYKYENTMDAFQKAYDMGADGIELDVQLTADGVPVVIHDLNMFRVAGVKQNITDIHSSELQQLKVGKKFWRILFGHPIPTLIDAILFCEMHHMALNIELKESVAENRNSIKEIIEKASIIGELHISSFDYTLLENVKEIDQKVETALLMRKKAVDWNNLSKYIAADGFNFHKRLWKEPYLGNMVNTGKKLRVYGVTGHEEIAKNPPAFVDGWITDYPNRF
ncbi:glycerophosphodiester phosphodiesterase family protein [Sporosarcina sp. USHLN248]|uniref:glycerophosphodiester phosphodiesterase n=1 Tax=Sporosarcina sp. USHLN248 TaxID=3081300 RepID=UPI00301A2ABA